MHPLIFAKLHTVLQAFWEDVNQSPELSNLAPAPPDSAVLQMSNAAEAVYDAAAKSFDVGYEAATD